MKKISLIVFILFSNLLNAQDFYDRIKFDYDRLRKESKNDSALIFAKHLNYIALNTDSNQIFRKIESLRLIGNEYFNLATTQNQILNNNQTELLDSAICYYNKSSILSIDFDYLQYIKALNNISIVYSKKNKHHESIEFIDSVVKICSNINLDYQTKHVYEINRVNAYINAALYTISDNYFETEKYALNAFKFYDIYSLDNPFLLLNIFNCLGQSYLGMNLLDKSEYYYKKAIDLNLNESYALMANIYNSYGLLVHWKSKYDEALIYFNKSSDFSEKDYKQCYNSTFDSLSKLKCTENYVNSVFMSNYNIAYMNFNIKRYAASIDFSEHLLRFNEYLSDKNSVALYDLLGLNYFYLKDYSKSLDYFLKAYDVIKKSKQIIDVDFANVFYHLGRAYIHLNDFNSASIYLEKFKELDRLITFQNFSLMSENDRKYFYNIRNTNVTDLLISDISIKKNNQLTTILFDRLTFEKAILLETTRELDEAIENSSDEFVKITYFKKKELLEIYQKFINDESKNKEKISSYLRQIDSLDKILVNSFSEYSIIKRKFDISWKNIQEKLNEDEVAIEFDRYYDENDSMFSYIALVLRRDYDFPKLVKLGNENDIKKIIKEQNFSDLYYKIWSGIDSLLVGIKKVYYSPAGELNNIAFSSLCYKSLDTTYFINTTNDIRTLVPIENIHNQQKCSAYLIDKYQLNQLTTTRYLADGAFDKQNKMHSTISLFGGVNYEVINTRNKIISKLKTIEDSLLELNISKISLSANRNFNMQYLPETRTEINNIANILGKYDWEITRYMDTSAQEFIIKEYKNQNSPGILHIATHGFAFPDEVKIESKQMEMNQIFTHKTSEDPMLRCGLMLSGSNVSWNGEPQKMIEQTGEDGILTASEVSNLDLSNTKLVVLSACETGLGKIEGSEGTFGLKRGFKLAGVEQIIVSLWSVPDKETMELMTLFYSDLAKTLNPVISFEKAQKEMRIKYPTEPEKWAGFVLVR